MPTLIQASMPMPFNARREALIIALALIIGFADQSLLELDKSGKTQISPSRLDKSGKTTRPPLFLRTTHETALFI